MRYEFRPLAHWTDRETPERQSSGLFRATWDATLRLLCDEARLLGADLVVIQVVADGADLRRDGMLRARARIGHPGAVVSFTSDHGPLRYATDQYEQRWTGAMPAWQANVRAIALALGSLRAVDRYGVSRRGEQYRGWTALPAARAGTSEWFTTRQDAAEWMVKATAEAGLGPTHVGLVNESLYKALARRMHPDAPGGSRELWDRLDAAATMLGIRRGNA